MVRTVSGIYCLVVWVVAIICTLASIPLTRTAGHGLILVPFEAQQVVTAITVIVAIAFALIQRAVVILIVVSTVDKIGLDAASYCKQQGAKQHPAGSLICHRIVYVCLFYVLRTQFDASCTHCKSCNRRTGTKWLEYYGCGGVCRTNFGVMNVL